MKGLGNMSKIASAALENRLLTTAQDVAAHGANADDS